MSRLSPRTLALLAVLLVTAAPAQEPRIVAETSDFRATSRYADVVAFCDQLAQQAPAVVRLGELGTTGEGRKLPLLILADPPVATPEEAKRSGKLVVYAQGNIHAGEVDGKESLMMLARDIALGDARPLLKDLVIVFCPIFNADGNERIDKSHRTEQNGPVEGVGVRFNAQDLDLNRDFVKLESPEVRALVRFLRRWDPAVILDLHTTNGSYHRYTLTYDGPRHPNAGEALIGMARDKLLPAVGKIMEERTGYPSYFYGDFSRDHQRWESYPVQPRYGIQYFALRHRIGILSESYTYAPFKDRVLAGRAFTRGVLEYAAAHKDEVRKAIQATPPSTVALRTQPAPLPAPVSVLGYVEKEEDGKIVPTKEPRDYPVQVFQRAETTLAVTLPNAYLIPAAFPKVVEDLQRHGVALEELREDIELDVEAYRVQKIERAARAFQKHNLVRVEAAARKEARRVPAGTLIVRTAQPLGPLAAYLLEPMAEDGLTTWNFFDAGLVEGQDFPVLRLPTAAPVTAGSARPLAEDRVMNKPITVEDYLGGGGAGRGGRGGRGSGERGEGMGLDFRGNPISGPVWFDDGEHFLQVKSGRVLKVEARTGRSEPFLDTAKLEQSLKALPTLNAAGAKRLAGSMGRRIGPQSGEPLFVMNPQRSGGLFEHENDLYLVRFDGTPAVRLTKSPGAKERSSFSPDGQFVAYLRDGNLFVTDLATQAERALTTDGGGNVVNGRGDWVYEEEVFNRGARGYWWSPNSQLIAFLRVDDTPVNKFTVVDFLPTRQRVETTAYPKAGDPNPLATFGIVSVAGGDIHKPDLANYSPTDALLVRVGWTPDSEHVYFYVQNRAQTWLDFCTCGSGGGAVTRLFRETTPAWVDDPGDPHFLADGSFLLASERNGWKHLYHFDAAGKLLKPITSGPWEVRGPGGGPFQGKSLHYLDAKNGWVYVTGTRDRSTATNLYRVRLDGSGTVERLTKADGDHSVNVNPTGTLFVDTCSDPATPTQVRLAATDGTPVRTLDTNPVYHREEYRFGPFERVHIPTPDGFVLEGSVVKPADFDPTKRYPVWFMTYGGPHAPTIREDWAGGRVYDQVLAALGFIVFRADPRSASGKGAQSTWACYRKLGVQELKDVETAIDWLCRNPWADGKRVGLAGGSYGGFMTCFALTHSTRFAAGVATAPVTDWRNYDSIYTERYMNTPQENPEGYDATSVVKAARKLHGKLLLVHGLMDDNVHVQNSLQFIQELEKADKDFEVLVYPRARHGVAGRDYSRHYQRQVIQFIQRTLGGPE